MTKPTIHSNGTSGADLADAYGNARRALELADEHLHAASPNARDYYPQGDSANTQARAEHHERREKIRAVIADMEALQMHCLDEIYARELATRKVS